MRRAIEVNCDLGAAAEITLAQPKFLNAITAIIISELEGTAVAAIAAAGVKALVFAGAGRA